MSHVCQGPSNELCAPGSGLSRVLAAPSLEYNVLAICLPICKGATHYQSVHEAAVLYPEFHTVAGFSKLHRYICRKTHAVFAYPAECEIIV
jgi:hypothetical protein